MIRWLATIAALVALTLIASARGEVPRSGVARDRCDLIELNSFYDDYGRLTFQQIIFYDWSHDEGRYQVRAWRLVKHPAQLPQRDWINGGYVTTWSDGELLRVVRCGEVSETFTQFDRELAERDALPKERRAELTTMSVRPCRAGGK